MNHLVIELKGESLQLHPDKTIYWEKEQTLFLADLHLGKGTHFSKNGIPIPASVSANNHENLVAAIERDAIKKVVFLGDLFHSDYNEDWEKFGANVLMFEDVEFILVKGNHDILNDEKYAFYGLEVVESLNLGPFYCTHFPQKEVPEGMINFCGHVHPAARMIGKARQVFKFPCYYITDKVCIFPAFGAFTGTSLIKPKEEDRVYVVAGEKVFEVHAGDPV